MKNLKKKYNNIKKYIKISLGGCWHVSLITMFRFFKNNKFFGFIYEELQLEAFIKKNKLNLLRFTFYSIIVHFVLNIYAIFAATLLSNETL